MQQEKKVIIGIAILIILIIMQMPKSQETMSIWLFKASLGEQPQYCINFAGYGILCPGDAEFTRLFNCNEQFTPCPQGMTCMSSGECVQEKPVTQPILLVIAAILIFLWVRKKD